ncbi:MAG: tetratricopeptide repeat protein, partial [Inhella sp.]
SAAQKLAATIQQQRPKESIGHLIEGDIESSRKAWSKAAHAYRRALERNANDSEAAIKLHVALNNAGQLQEAGRFADAWLTNQPSDPSFPGHLAEEAVRDKRFTEAESLYQRALDARPQRAADWNSLAQVRLQLNKPALEAAQEAVRRGPDSAYHWQTLALAQSAAGQHQEALANQRKAIIMSGQQPDARLVLAKLLLAAGKRDEARSELQSLTTGSSEFGGRSEASDLLHQLR